MYYMLRDEHAALVQRWLVEWTQGQAAALKYTHNAISAGILTPDIPMGWDVYEAARKVAERIYQGRVGRVLRADCDAWRWDFRQQFEAANPRNTLLFCYDSPEAGERFFETQKGRVRLSLILKAGVRVIRFRSPAPLADRYDVTEMAVVPPVRIVAAGQGYNVVPATWEEWSR